MDTDHSREKSSCSAIDLAEIRGASKISSWIWSIISGLVIVLGRPGRGASHVEKSPSLYWTTQFWRWLKIVHVTLMFLSEWREFPSAPCLQEKKVITTRISMFLKSARRLICFLSASVTRKDLQSGTWTYPSFQQHFRFRPKTWGNRSCYGHNSTLS